MLTNEKTINQPLAPAAEKQRIVTANSLILFLLAYLFCYLASQLATVTAAFSARIPTVFHLGHLEFKIPDSAWRAADVVLVYAAGPVVALIIAMAAAVFFIIIRKKRGLKKTFLVWTFLHGCNLFFGALIAGTITKTGFWYAVRWSGFSDPALWLITFFCVIILLFIGIMAAPAFLFSCDSISLMEFQNRPKMLTATVIHPWLFGGIFLTALKFPDLHYYEALQLFTLLLLLLPVYILNQQNLFSETVQMPRKTRLAQTALILLVLLAAMFRLVLQNGRFIG